MKNKWNLDDIVSLEAYDELYKAVEREIDEIDKWVEQLDPRMKKDDFKNIMEKREKLEAKLARLAYRPHLMEAVDQKNQRAKQLKSRSDDLRMKCAQKVRRIDHWIKGKEVEGKRQLDEKNAKRLFSAIADLKYELTYSRGAAKYTLEEREEDIISNKDINGVRVLTDLRTMIETEFEYEMKEGEEKKIIKTQAELMAYVYSPIADKREAAYRALLEKHKENLDKFFMIYQAVVKNWRYETKMRGFEEAISARNFNNRVPDRAVEVLLEICRQNRHIFQEFFKMKAKDMGLKKMRRFDIYAPSESVTKKIDYKEAENVVLESFGKFGERFRNYAWQIVEEKHLDSHPGATKRSGAFCATVEPSITPYVLMNFTGNIRDMSVLAHELGHGVHSLYANKHFYSTQHANLPLAETASTLGEMILFETLYEQERDKGIKKAMLSEKIADTYASILRQNYFVVFEKRVHEQISKGLTAEEVSEMWMKTLREQFGESVELDPIFRYEWAYIPHIVETPFYCYAYNFGELLSYSLYSRYKEEGKSFIPKIEKILEAGGGEDPILILEDIGVDVNKAEFWQKSFSIIKDWVEKLKVL